MLACLAEAIGVAASVEWVTAFGIFISAVLLGGTFMGITAIGLMAARQLSGINSQRGIGLMTASFAVGQMIGPTVAGLLFDRLGSFRAPSLVAAVALVIAAALASVTSKAAAQQKSVQ
jgi:predicted MFS family arabinose efflux permease